MRRYLPTEIAEELSKAIAALHPVNKRVKGGIEVSYQGKKMTLPISQSQVENSKVSRFR